jgi:imidazolonepropionase-like amidohydrolase
MHEAGMPAMEAIQSATVAAADLLGQSDSIGSIEVGKFADIVAVDGDPTQRMEDILKMKFVMREGKVYKQD